MAPRASWEHANTQVRGGRKRRELGAVCGRGLGSLGRQSCQTRTVSKAGPKGQRLMRAGKQGGGAGTRSVPGLGPCAQTWEDQPPPCRLGFHGHQGAGARIRVALVCRAGIGSVHRGLTSCPCEGNVAVVPDTQPPRAHLSDQRCRPYLWLQRLGVVTWPSSSSPQGPAVHRHLSSTCHVPGAHRPDPAPRAHVSRGRWMDECSRKRGQPWG